MEQINLTQKQKEVMKWLGKKWSATNLRGSVWGINGEMVSCQTPTLSVLESHGLVEKDGKYQYKATEKGRSYTLENNL